MSDLAPLLFLSSLCSPPLSQVLLWALLCSREHVLEDHCAVAVLVTPEEVLPWLWERDEPHSFGQDCSLRQEQICSDPNKSSWPS